LHAQSVEFDDRNIRQSDEARSELLSLTDELIVPLVIYGDHQVVGFDPDGLDNIVQSYRETAAT
jgi:hypothetical protein